MEKEYYILALNNNKSRNPMKLDNIIYKGEEYNLPPIMIEAIKESVFESVEVLAVKGMISLRDVITGEVVVSSNTGITNGLSYYKAIKANRQDIIRITKLYESMSESDIQRYKNSIKIIKDRTIRLYNESENSNKKSIIEEKEAREFLVNFQNWNI